MRTVSITNQKGGVGKTTTSVNLAAAMANIPRRVLLIDLDPQGNATTGSGVDKRVVENTTAQALMKDALAGECIVAGCKGGYDLMPGNEQLTTAEVRLLELQGREFRLREALQPLHERYDYVFLDCPPSLNMLTLNGLVAADSVIIPTQCEYYALEGLSALMQTIERVRRTANPGLEIEGLLRTMYDSRNNLAQDVSSQLASHFGEDVYRTIIPRNVTLAEAPSHGLPVLLYDAYSRGAQAYLNLANEMLARTEGPEAVASRSQQAQ